MRERNLYGHEYHMLHYLNTFISISHQFFTFLSKSYLKWSTTKFLTQILLNIFLIILIYNVKRKRERWGLHRVCEPSTPLIVPEPKGEYHVPDEPNWIHQVPDVPYPMHGTHGLILFYQKMIERDWRFILL